MKKLSAARFLSLSLILICVLQGCGFRPNGFETPQSTEATLTLEAMPASTAVLPTSAFVPIVQSIEPTPDPFAFLFDKFEMKSETVGWGTAWITDESGGSLDRLLQTSDGGITWFDVTPPYDDPYLSIDDFVFLDGDHAWILNSSQASDSSSYFPIIWRTLDGGKQWERTIPVTFPAPPAGGYFISFDDEQHGRLDVASDVAAGTTTLSTFVTSDGGASWEQLPDTTATINDQTDLLSTLPPPEGIDLSGGCWSYDESRSFFPNQEGILQILCGSNLLLYHSHDDGKTWDPPFVRGPLTSSTLIDFVDVNTGWYRGTEDSPSNIKGAGLYVTHDGGEAWNEIIPTLKIDNLDLDQIPNGNVVELLTDFNFIDSNNGFALSDYWSGYSLMLKTTDGGLAWSSWVPHWQSVK